ncbi:hypothetical protein [Streptomyces sp. NPDC086782]|uniref:hypothetical protein n=1 Tax=Streptomyces sp. NPDC086782 TaxID=3365757 RepID=UPI003827DFF6
MTEYDVACSSDSRDILTARIDGGTVELLAERGGLHKMEVYAQPDAARTFARGILALADEIDGGEAPELKPCAAPKIGDRVRIMRNSPSDGGDNVGTVGILAAIDSADTVLPYRVALPGSSYDWWCAEVELVDEPEPDTRPKVGDQLRVTEDNPRYCPVVKNDVITVTATDYDHVGADGVRFQHGDDTYQWFVPLTAVEGPLTDWEVDLLTSGKPAPTTVPRVPTVSMRGDLVTQAKELLAGTEHTAADIVRLAEFLDGGE